MINKRRIKNLNNYLFNIQDNDNFYVGKKLSEVPQSRLTDIGFGEIGPGYQILPKALGPISRFNSEGKFIKLKHLPKETCYRDAILTDWHGNYQYVEIPYQRYQRKPVLPPCVQITVIEIKGELYIVSPELKKDSINDDYILHVFNLFLELFGSCEVLNKDMAPIFSGVSVKQVNWNILPPGEYPWEKLAEIADKVRSKSENKARLQKHYIETIQQLKPSEVIYGKGGFRGYFAFRFPSKGICILENILYGNATYVFDVNWEEISKMTKAEIIYGEYMLYRIVHRKGWTQKIKDLFD